MRVGTYKKAFVRWVLCLGVMLILSACAGTVTSSGRQGRQAFIQPLSLETKAIRKVGLLAPMSGSQSGLGKALLNAAQLAADDSALSKAEVVSADSGASAEQAAIAAERLLSQGVDVIVGPLFSSQAQAVRGVVREKVPVFSFSNNSSVAGQGVYALGFSLKDQAERILAYARGRGYKRIFVPVPETPTLQALAKDLAQSESLTIETYTPTMDSMSILAKKMAREIRRSDAVLLLEGGDNLRQLSSLIIYYVDDPTKVKFLGTNVWEDESMRMEGALRKGWFTSTPPELWVLFKDSYTQKYGTPPPRIASLAYDAVHYALTPASENGSPYQGVDGPLRFLADGTVQRDWVIREFDMQDSKVLKEAP